MTYTQPVTLALTPDPAFSGDLRIKLSCIADSPSLDKPGKEPGDLRTQVDATGKRSALVSLGPSEKIKPDTLRRVGGLLARWLEKNNVHSAGIEFDTLNDLPFTLETGLTVLAEGLLLGGFQFSKHKSNVEERPAIHINFLVRAEQSSQTEKLSPLLSRTADLTAATNQARSWAHEPPNVLNPLTLAERVGRLATTEGLQFTVIDDKQLFEMGAHAIHAVGKGSKTPSKLIILEYPGYEPEPDSKPLVLVGKAITFDTGGYSIKDRTGMLGMKYDKNGGMAVIGTLVAAARLKIKTPLVGIIATAENMISSIAYRPDDILHTLSGKTVEVVSADAEGRLVLCDALTYAQKNFQPRAIIDLATLTGGVVIALGKLRAGIMTNNQKLADALIASGENTHERLWQLPLDDEYFELIKGDDSDFKNSGAREAHAIIGGIFLKQFVANDVPWAHLDIAGVADIEKDMPYCPKGATGFGIRLLINYLEQSGS